MAKSIKKNYIYNLAYQMLILLTPLITVPYISRVLGPDGVGTISFAESVVAYFVLFANFSIGSHGKREISYAQDDVQKRSIVFWETMILKAITTSVALLAYLFFCFISVNETQKLLYMVLTLQIISVAVNVVWFFEGLEEFGKVVFRNFIVKFAWLVFIFLFVKTKEDLLLYLVGQTIIDFIACISLWSYLPKYVRKVSLNLLNPFRHLKTIIILFIPAIAVQVYTVLDKTMIGVITQDVFQNGYYEQAMKLVRMVLGIIITMSATMTPRVGMHFSRNEHDEIKRLMYNTYQFVWFIGVPLVLGLILISDIFVPWFFGIEFLEVATLIKVIAPIILCIGFGTVTGGQYLVTTQREIKNGIAVILGACINFTLNFVLIAKYQAVGAAIASVVAEITITCTLFYMVRNELDIFYILKSGVHYWIAGDVMALILLVIKPYMVPTIICTFFMIFIGSLVYFVVLLILRDAFLLNYLNKFLRKINRKIKIVRVKRNGS